MLDISISKCLVIDILVWCIHIYLVSSEYCDDDDDTIVMGIYGPFVEHGEER